MRTKSGDLVRNISRVEFFENHKNAAIEKGGEVALEGANEIVLAVPCDDSGKIWLRVTVDTGLKQQTVFNHGWWKAVEAIDGV